MNKNLIIMKNKITLLSFFLAFTSFVAFSQKTVNARDIIKDIKAGKTVSISNATIVGNLDFTDMEEKLKDLPKRKRRWWSKGGSNTVKNQIKTKISFVNCVFKDHVLAYIPDGDYSRYTFTANFEDDAIFKNCTFERKAMFKYSIFERTASFENAKFQDETTFKYAKFHNYISFANSTFDESATFKYSKFKDGVSFKNVNFEEDLNIKYTQVKGKFSISGMKVGYDIDSKYTKINGRSFSKYLLDNQ